jgi:hypothetical protein
VDDLKPLASLLGKAPLKKDDLIKMLAGVMENKAKVRELYSRLGEMGQRSVQEATHHPHGVLDVAKLQAKYGGYPDLGGSGHRYGDKRSWRSAPTTMPQRDHPVDGRPGPQAPGVSRQGLAGATVASGGSPSFS